MGTYALAALLFQNRSAKAGMSSSNGVCKNKDGSQRFLVLLAYDEMGLLSLGFLSLS